MGEAVIKSALTARLMPLILTFIYKYVSKEDKVDKFSLLYETSSIFRPCGPRRCQTLYNH